MIISISGQEDIGKYELARELQSYFYFRSPENVKPVHISRYSGFEAPKTYHQQMSKIHYEDMFKIIQLNIHHDRIRIFSGCHLDEYVFGCINNDYNTDFVFELEKKYKPFLNHVRHITLVSDI